MIEDYYIDLYFVEKVREPDGTGGFEYVYKVGNVFKGSATKSGVAEQTLAGVRGEFREQYTITTPDNIALQASDVIMFKNVDGQKVFLKINSNPTYTPNQSGQSHWKYMTATEIEPDLRVVN